MRFGTHALVFSLVLAALAQGCGGVLFFPSKKIEVTPRDIGLAYEDVVFPSEDRLALHGWFLPARYEGLEPAGTVVFVHGNAGNLGGHLGAIYWLPSAGFQVFMFDYRGFGDSAGDADLAGAHADSRAAIRAAASRKDVDPERIAVLGQSIGGAIALTTVASIGTEIPVRGLVVDSAPSDFRRIAREKLGDLWLTWPLQYPLALLVPSSPRPLDAAAKLAGTRLLFVHGDRDAVVPLRHSIRLAEAAGGAELVIAPGVEHGRSFEDPTVRKRVVEFLNDVLEPSANVVARASRRDP